MYDPIRADAFLFKNMSTSTCEWLQPVYSLASESFTTLVYMEPAPGWLEMDSLSGQCLWLWSVLTQTITRPVSPHDSTAPFNFSAWLSTVLIGIISFATMLQIQRGIPSPYALFYVLLLLANTAGILGCCVPLLMAEFVLFTGYMNELVIELLSFKTASHVLHLASLLFFSSKYSHRGLRFDHFMSGFSDVFTVSEPFGVGVVASCLLVQAGKTLNQHDIISTENSPVVKHRFQLIENHLI